MNQFILIDHSLDSLGGHHYPYAHSVLSAAADAGFAPVLATHRDFSERAAFDANWRVLPLFEHGSYSRHTLDTQSPWRSWREPASRNIWERLRHAVVQRARRTRTRAFASGCARLFAEVPLSKGDIVFIGTASELDLAGLAEWLQDARVAEGVSWHLQFHFGIFRGRPSGYARQSDAATAMRAALSTSLERLRAQRLHFYCTTEALSAEYRRLALVTFDTLPYPVHALFGERRALRLRPHPAIVACLGHMRREKGLALLPSLLDRLWRDYFATGRARLRLQVGRERQRRQLQRACDALPSAKAMSSTVKALEFASTQLDLPRYAQLLCDSDVGLLLYDGERYYDRCSGVLLEMLVAGVPVVVPAGSWLAEQITPANQQYLAELMAAMESPGDGAQFHWQGRELPVLLTTPQSLGTAALDDAARMLLVQFHWQSPAEPGHYLRLQLTGFDASGSSIQQCSQIAARNVDGTLVTVAFALQAGVKRIDLIGAAAWNGQDVSIADLRVACRNESMPIGAVGVSIAEPADATEALRDILDHIAHYKRRSADWALHFEQRQSAAAIVSRLMANHRAS